MLEHILQEIGLSEKEAKVYLVCLKFPELGTSTIAQKATLNRGTAFVIVHELLKKGLVKKSINSDVQRFSAVPPEELLEYVEKKQTALEYQRQRVEQLIPEFKNLAGAATSKPIFNFYEGKEGLQNLLSEMLRADHDELRHIKAIVSPAHLDHSVGSDFVAEFTRKRIKKRYHLSLLLAYDDHELKELGSDDTEFRTTRYLPELLTFPMTIFLFDQTALLFSHSEHFGLSIDSNEYVKMQETFFDTLWAISKTEIRQDDFRMPLI